MTAYLTWSLLVEVNGVFLHLRRLLTMAGAKRDGPAYRLNLVILFTTFFLVRIGAHLALLMRVYMDYSIFPSTFSFGVAFCGMILMNLYNFVLLKDLLIGEFFRKKEKKKD